MSAKKYRMSKCYVTSEKDWVWSSVKMADLWSAVQAINDLIVRIETMENSSEIGSIVLKLDFINRMLVSLDVPDDIVNTTSALYETVVAIDRENGPFHFLSATPPIEDQRNLRGRGVG